MPLQPLRGQVYLANLNPPEGIDPGREHKGDWKPVLILQVDQLNRTYGTVVIVPLTTTLTRANLPTTVLVEKGVPGTILPESFVALCHQVRALDIRKLRTLAGMLPAKDTHAIAEMVKKVIGVA